MRKPDRKELAATVFPVFAAEAMVVGALFAGTIINIQNHTLWGYLAGLFQ